MLSVVVGLGACLSPPDYPVEPVLTFVGLSKDTLLQAGPVLARDTFFLRLSFTDGDGDIGNDQNSARSNVFVENKLTGDTLSPVLLSPIPEEGAQNGVSGELTVRLFSTCCDFPDFTVLPCEPSDEYPLDTLLLEAYMIDRAGNESNRVDLPPIILRCDR